MLNVMLIGAKFMGRAHTNAWSQAGKFFALPLPINLHTVSAQDPKTTKAFAERWGWQNSSTEWAATLRNETAINLVDIATPNHHHAAPAIAALEAGKHVVCEKPLAGTLTDARAMFNAAKKAKRRGLKTFVWFNYRRCPAVALAHQLVAAGKLGRIFHLRATYLQDWGGPQTPLHWRFQQDAAGSGAHGDLNAHLIDLARFITGENITEVVGAIEETFIKKRPLPNQKKSTRRGKMGKSTVDDCALFLARFKSGTTAAFEATRLATGNKNRNAIEINGEFGSLKFNFERMNELEYFNAAPGIDPATQGWKTILCTSAEGKHPYLHAWWPEAHLLGYEHTFTNQVADIVRALAGQEPEVPLPDFADAFETQLILEAALRSARERRPVTIKELR